MTEFTRICLQLTARLDEARLRAVSGGQKTKTPTLKRTIKEMMRTYMVVETSARLPLNNLTWLLARQILLVFSKGEKT
jgi:hypothetical protein